MPSITYSHQDLLNICEYLDKFCPKVNYPSDMAELDQLQSAHEFVNTHARPLLIALDRCQSSSTADSANATITYIALRKQLDGALELLHMGAAKIKRLTGQLADAHEIMRSGTPEDIAEYLRKHGF